MIKAVIETRQDLVSGFLRWELWGLLAWNEIRQKYRRSAVGPFWASINFAVFVGALGFLYSELFGQDLEVYLPHLILGLLVWNFVSQVVLEGCHLFESMRSYILEVNVPLTSFLYVLIWKNMIIFGYSFLVFLIVAIALPIVPSSSWVIGILGLCLVLINALWMSLFTAVVAARYHDLIEVVGSVFRILFFLTPIIWLPGMEGRFDVLLDVNPIYHLIEVFRAHMTGGRASQASWIVSILLALGGWLITSLLYSKYRSRIAFWI